jgi:hypothetical protein
MTDVMCLLDAADNNQHMTHISDKKTSVHASRKLLLVMCSALLGLFVLAVPLGAEASPSVTDPGTPSGVNCSGSHKGEFYLANYTVINGDGDLSHHYYATNCTSHTVKSWTYKVSFARVGSYTAPCHGPSIGADRSYFIKATGVAGKVSNLNEC